MNALDRLLPYQSAEALCCRRSRVSTAAGSMGRQSLVWASRDVKWPRWPFQRHHYVYLSYESAGFFSCVASLDGIPMNAFDVASLLIG